MGFVPLGVSVAFDLKNVLEHELVPKHEVLSKKEAEQVLTTYKATPDQFPRIKLDDPVVQALGAKKGEMIKITRKSLTAGEAEYYRIVVP